MSDVFLSYRRADSPGATGRLADSLYAALGADRVFRDLEAITPGVDFEATLHRAIEGARVVLVVIGPRWMTTGDASGQRRLHDAHDMVRREIETALDLGLPVIPVLVEGARMPSASVLPASLEAFARCQAIELSDLHWREDCERLVALLRTHHGVDPGARTASRLRGPLWVLDVVELLVRPRRVLMRLAGDGGLEALGRALGLLALSLVGGNLLSGVALDGAGLLGWVFNASLLGLLLAAVLGGLAMFAWRLAGVKAGWQRMVAGASSLFAGGWLYFNTGVMVMGLGIGLTDTSTMPTLLALIRQGPVPHAELQALMLERLQGPTLAAALVAGLLWIAGVVWLLVAWNAWRIALVARALAGAVAAILLMAAVGGLIVVMNWAAHLA